MAALLFVYLSLWLAFPPPDEGIRPDFFRRMAGEMLGSAMMIVMAIALLLGTRFRFLESLFGGLDKVYAAHRTAGVAAFALLLLHFLVIPFAPGEVPPGRAPGYIAFGGIVILVVLTLAPRIPIIRRLLSIGYRRWRVTHKFIGIFFIMGTAHMLLVDSLVRTTVLPFVVLMSAIVVGIGSYLYTLLVAGFVRRKADYRVLETNRLNARVVEVVLRPVKRRLKHSAGQFVYLRFKGDRIPKEPHPFTVSSSPTEENMRVTISAAGDYTKYLYSHLKTGTRAIVEGGYGKLDYRSGGREQIWIAGGIGITPFMSWIREMPAEPGRSVDFFYTAKTRDEALFVTELLEAERQHADFRVHLHYSAEQGRLTMEQVANTLGRFVSDQHIYMCGPSTMLASFEREFRQRGVPASNIHYERFSFR